MTKIRRFYWREIEFFAMRTFIQWCSDNGQEVGSARKSSQGVFEAMKGEAVEHFKQVHSNEPLYSYETDEAANVVEKFGIKVVALDGTYVAGAGKDRPLLANGERLSPEDFAARHYTAEGNQVIKLESAPFHCMFGVLMWLWVQAPSDGQLQATLFGGRDDAPHLERDEHDLIWFMYPPDFGTAAHAHRRKDALEEHLEWLPDNTEILLGIFDYWRVPSIGLCAYLWAYSDAVVEKAKTVIEVIGAPAVKQILRCLAEDYWARFLGWPDLFVWCNREYKLVEVKSSKDRLSENQQHWVGLNEEHLHLPFEVVKIHKKMVVSA